MTRTASAALFALAAAVVSGGLVFGARACHAKGLGDCEKKVPADAERVFGAVAAAFKRADAAGVTASMAPTREARLFLALAGLSSGSYAREQATTLMSNDYFPARKIVSLMPADGCTTGDDTQLTRIFRMRVQIGREDRDGTLTIEIVKRKIGDNPSAWFLGGLKEP